MKRLCGRIAPVIASVLLFISLAPPVLAGAAVYTSWGKAINGYDPVAYFTEGKPIEGKSSFTLDWMGAQWRFANASNRDTFAKDPSRYAPQYGGYCAWAVSQGSTASTTPEAWKIVGGKLYLNYSKSIQKRWESDDVAKLIAAGDANWPEIKAKLEN